MGSKLKAHLSYANVMATIAVFGVLGGGAYAATAAKNTVSSKSVKNDSLKGIDINESTLVGVTGPAGPIGLTGPAGAPGSNAFGKLDYNVSADVANLDGDQDFVEVACDPGMRVVGGGVYSTSGGVGDQAINSSFPTDGSGFGEFGTQAWGGYVDNNDIDGNASDHNIRAYAICADAAQVTKSESAAAKD